MMNGGMWNGFVENRLEILWLLGTVLCDGWSILLLPNIMVGPMYLIKLFLFCFIYYRQSIIIFSEKL
jgi:hypothetical protein